MKVKATRVFYDNAGLHRKGETFEAETFIPDLMEEVKVDASSVAAEKKTKKRTTKEA